MPCINVAKKELHNIADRWPDHIEKIARWERLVSAASKKGKATFFAADTNPVTKTSNFADISLETHGIHAVVEWSRTARGGRHMDAIATDRPYCESSYGLCE